MKKLAKTKILTMLFMLLSILMLSSCGTSLGEPTRIDKEFNILNNANISIDIQVADISIELSPDEKIYITYYEYDIVKYKIDESYTKFILKQNIDENLWSGIKDPILGVTILVPKAFIGEFKTVSDVGDIAIENIAAKSINLNADVGDIGLSKLNGIENITINVNVGDITGSIVGTKSDFTIKSSAHVGDNNIGSGGSGKKKLNIETNVGDIDISFIK